MGFGHSLEWLVNENNRLELEKRLLQQINHNPQSLPPERFQTADSSNPQQGTTRNSGKYKRYNTNTEIPYQQWHSTKLTGQKKHQAAYLHWTTQGRSSKCNLITAGQGI